MPEKGPPVFLDYDQAALDAAYDQAAYAPNREQLIKRRICHSELAHRRIGEPGRVAYGSDDIERLDIYRAGRKLAPVFIFIHGGAWRSGRSKEFAAPAEMFLAAGAHYVVPDFAWVQDVVGVRCAPSIADLGPDWLDGPPERGVPHSPSSFSRTGTDAVRLGRDA